MNIKTEYVQLTSGAWVKRSPYQRLQACREEELSLLWSRLRLEDGAYRGRDKDQQYCHIGFRQFPWLEEWFTNPLMLQVVEASLGWPRIGMRKDDQLLLDLAPQPVCLRLDLTKVKRGRDYYGDYWEAVITLPGFDREVRCTECAGKKNEAMFNALYIAPAFGFSSDPLDYTIFGHVR